MKKIRAIETSYAGCRFRSRLEARWAVFFDKLGIEWEHEPEGFETSAGRYLPDFQIRVPSDGYPYWFEVKPSNAPHDERHRVLCVETATPTIVARGMPRNYRDQMRGDKSAITAMLWGDRLGGAQYPAGDERPEELPCAFVGLVQGLQCALPMPDGREKSRFISGWPDNWDLIHKARHWKVDQFQDVHVALYSPGNGWTPADSLDVDDAYAAARSARFGD